VLHVICIAWLVLGCMVFCSEVGEQLGTQAAIWPFKRACSNLVAHVELRVCIKLPSGDHVDREHDDAAKAVACELCGALLLLPSREIIGNGHRVLFSAVAIV
jgi:hypothetical protein